LAIFTDCNIGYSFHKIEGMRLTGSTFLFYSTVFILIFLLGCSSEPDKPFTELSPSHTNIYFSNDLENTPEFNIQNYLYFYDGGGVAVGDINNNGLPDLFFTGNDVPNKLYINKGEFEFEDITERAGIINNEGSWSTGVTMADVNGNGYLDIYVSRVNYLTKSGANQLFINNGDETFTESAAEYGLDFEGYSTQAAFFDYNSNGRLDMFLLNHSFHSEATYGVAEQLRQRRDLKAGDRLFRNDGGYFTDVTEEAGIISSALGYGLGLAIADINQDGYPDIYVGNDFHEDDYFYINNGDGTFTNQLYSMMGHTSNSSMGNDIADITNNGRPDLISLDMMPDDHDTFMRSGGPDPMIVYSAKRNFGFGEKNNRNTLQVNRGPGSDGLPLFSEIAFASGIAKTEWSWSALLADFDNSGHNDLFITNGMPHRPNDLDYIAALRQVREQYEGDELQQREYDLIQRMPTVHVPNYMFKNNGDLSFVNITDEWGFSKPHYSNGAVYADLNNNGKLDLVVNNINERALIYRNSIPDSLSGNFIRVKLNGDSANTTAIGSKLFVYTDAGVHYREQMPTRGFQSSVDHILHVGLGTSGQIDSLLVIWPDHKYQTLTDVSVNRLLELDQSDAGGRFDYSRLDQSGSAPLLRDVSRDVNMNHTHRENTHDDFNREPLMPYKQSTRGPALAVADVNGNGRDDIFIGGSRGFSGKLFLQQSDGTFIESVQDQFNSDRRSEDVDAIFFDATGNGVPDLFVVSGGNEFTGEALELLDRLYINDGNGNFARSMNSVPDIAVNGSVAVVADYNGNGHLDLFVGGHTVPWRYGIGPQSFLYENNGNGVFQDVTEQRVPELETIGNVTSAAWIVHENGDLPDLIVTGEWMPIHYFENRNGNLLQKTEEFGLGHLKGLWQSVEAADLTGNGRMDIIAGNFGINSRIQASRQSSIKMYVNDFDGDGQSAPVLTYTDNGIEKPFEQLDELILQIPGLTNLVSSYRDYATKSIDDLFDRVKLDESLQKEIVEMRSMVLLNDSEGEFTEIVLPFEAQWFPVMALYAEDIDGDGITDLLLAGNIFDVKPSVGGRQDAGHGLVLKGDGEGNFKSLEYSESGLIIKGETRSVKTFRFSNGERGIVVARNDQSPLFFKWNGN
jgi:enediyne biosynthesis protein E4